MKFNYILMSLIVLLIIGGFLVTVNIWMALIIGVFLLLFYILLGYAINYLNNRIIEQFAVLNTDLGLNIEVPPRKLLRLARRYPRLRGRFLQRSIEIKMYDKVVVGRPAPVTEIIVDILHYGNTFTIKSETWWTTLKKFFGKNDITTSDKEFDRLFYLEASNPGLLIKLLDEDIRDIMKYNVSLKSGILSAQQAQLIYQEQLAIGTTNERKRLEKVILIMYMIAKKLEKGRR